MKDEKKNNDIEENKREKAESEAAAENAENANDADAPEAEEPVVEQAEETEAEKLRKELEAAKKLADEYKDKWMRNVAEFDNYKKRNAKLWQDAYSEGISSVILKVLPVGDNLERALSLGLDEKTEEGVRGILRKYEDTLKGIGIEEINPAGKKFDPNVAEAVMQVEPQEGDESENVKQVFEKGYKFKDKIIRYAKVSVIK